jgi:ParB family protein of integrating conjugative element (PFGI_1 class)
MAKNKLDLQQIGNKLMSPGFAGRNAPHTTVAPSDPVADTPMVLTLDQLRPYDKNPRINKNPKYEEIKESIKARGLDQIPGITRRPGEEFYIIRDGGNTRLSILNELWLETRDENFFRLNVLYRPWQGEIRALTGHLAENDVRGGLSLIERALGVEAARAEYEQAEGGPISQRELSRRLKADGYPISNSHISRMQDVIRYLLPAIPQMLYAGLGIDPAVKLIALRKAAEAAWNKHKPDALAEFDEVFIEALSAFNESEDTLNYQRVLDELTGQMSDVLSVDYNLLSLDIQEESTKSRRPEPAIGQPSAAAEEAKTDQQVGNQGDAEVNAAPNPDPATLNQPGNDESLKQADQIQEIEQSVPSAKPDAVKKPSSSGIDDAPKVEPKGVLKPGAVHTDIWDIEQSMDEPNTLRGQILQLARAIAAEVGLPDNFQSIDGGIGFHYARPWSEQPEDLSNTALSTLMLIESLSGVYAVVQQSLQDGTAQAEGLMEFQFSAHLGQLLMGNPAEVSEGSPSSSGRLSDAAVIKLFRVIRLARRLIDLDSDFRQE